MEDSSSTEFIKHLYVAVIGDEKIGQTIVSMLLQKSILEPHNIYRYHKGHNILSNHCANHKDHEQFNFTDDYNKINQKFNIVILASKPAELFEFHSVCYRSFFPNSAIISFVSGVSMHKLFELRRSTNHYQCYSNTVRAVTNISSTNSKGLILYCNTGLSIDHQNTLEILFSKLGNYKHISEEALDVATCLFESGPNYIQSIIEALANGAVKNGLSRELANMLVAEVFTSVGNRIGNGESLVESGNESPFTIAGAHELERGAVRSWIMDAIDACLKKLKELNLNTEKI